MDRQQLLLLEAVIKQFRKRMINDWRRNAANLGLTDSQAMIIDKLRTDGPQKVSELADVLCMTSGAVTGMSDKLIEHGYARRERPDGDRRVVYLTLTEDGQRVAHTIQEERIKLMESMFESLPTDDIQSLIRIFSKLTNNVS